MSPTITVSPVLPKRIDVLDALRGLAVIFMVAFHFCYDLNFFGFVQFDFYRAPFWLHSRTLIVTMFITIAGASLYWANRQGITPKFWLREAILLACAVSISLVTFLLFGPTWIFFGVLHFMVVASLLGVLALRAGHFNLVLGVILIAIGNGVQFPFFDHQPWQWFGLMTHKPVTEDYVPLLPWLGVLLMGIWLGWRWQTWPALQRPLTAPAWEPLLWLGRHSLLVYMLHQPLLFGLCWAAFTFATYY